MDVFNWFAKWMTGWMNSEMGIIYFTLGLQICCIGGSMYFSATGLLSLKKGLISENRKTLLNGTSSLVLAVALLIVFSKLLNIKY